ncbi:MAG: hypothetical protein ACYC0H_08400 [Solirubrobacteraceae bacterium]
MTPFAGEQRLARDHETLDLRRALRELQIPEKRSGGSYFPSFLEPWRRCEQ